MKKYLYFLLGSATLALAVVFAIASKVGLGAFDAISYNGSVFFKTTVGISMNGHILVLLIILLIIDFSPKYIFGAIIALSTGLFIDFYHLFIHLPDIGNFDFIYFIIALPLFPIGVGMMINSTVPVGPIEQLPLLVSSKYEIKYLYVKTSFEVLYVATAFVYGYMSGIGLGAIMLGTIIITLYIGPAISYARVILPQIKEA